MRRLRRLSAIAVVVLAAACGDNEIPLGVEAVGPGAPSSPGPQGPKGTGPGRIGTGGGSSDVAGVVIAPASMTLQVGDSVQVVAAAVDESGQAVRDATFSWASSDAGVARVRAEATQSAVAVVTGVGSGTAAISVTAGGVGATALVVVLPPR